jgi:hypothetical protein
MCLISTPSVYFYLSLDSVKLHYPATNKKKRREYLLNPADILNGIWHPPISCSRVYIVVHMAHD